MERDTHAVLDIFARYSILVLIGILGVKFFYAIFTSMTIYPVYSLLKIFFDASLMHQVILINTIPIEIIGPCIAGSAYFLLLILNLSIPNIKLDKRIYLVLFSFLSLLVINILRIFLLSILFVRGISFFDITHKLFWYVGSTVFVVGIWFLGVKLFRIKGVPFYSDIKFLSDHSAKKSGKKVKKTKSSKKH